MVILKRKLSVKNVIITLKLAAGKVILDFLHYLKKYPSSKLEGVKMSKSSQNLETGCFSSQLISPN